MRSGSRLCVYITLIKKKTRKCLLRMYVMYKRTAAGGQVGVGQLDSHLQVSMCVRVRMRVSVSRRHPYRLRGVFELRLGIRHDLGSVGAGVGIRLRVGVGVGRREWE